MNFEKAKTNKYVYLTRRPHLKQESPNNAVDIVETNGNDWIVRVLSEPFWFCCVQALWEFEIDSIFSRFNLEVSNLELLPISTNGKQPLVTSYLSSVFSADK